MGDLFGDVARRALRDAGWSATAAAKAIPVDPGYLSRVLNNRQRPSLKLAEALDRLTGANGALAGIILDVDQTARVARSTTNPSRLDAGTVDALADVLASFRRLDDSVQPQTIIPAATAQTKEVTRLLKGARGPYRDRLAAVVSEHHLFTGWLLAQDRRTDAAAVRWLDSALDIADSIGDGTLASAALNFRGFQARAVLRKVLAGDPPGGPRAYGYDRTGWKLVPDEARWVRWMFQQFNAGGSLSGIAAELNRRGIPNRSGAAWTHNSVRHVLGNERYAALRTHQGKVYPGKWPRTVSEPVLRAAQQKLADSDRRTSPGPASAHLLTGLAECGVPGCVNPNDLDGQPYRVTSSSRGAGKPCYRCAGRVKHLVRDMPQINRYVTDVLVSRLQAADVAALLVDDGQDEALEDARREAVALRTKLEGLGALLADPNGGLDPADFASAARAVRDRLAVLEGQMADGERSRILGDFATGRPAADVWESLPLDRRRAVAALLLRVRLLPAGQFSKHRFDPRSVDVQWLGSPVVVREDDAVTLDGLDDQDAADLYAAVREAGWDVTRRGGCVTVRGAGAEAARTVAEDLTTWNLTYPTDGLAVAEAVRAVVDAAPALTVEQRDRLAGLLG